MKRWLPLAIFALIVSSLILIPATSRADELDDTLKALDAKKQELQQAEQALTEAKKQESQLTGSLSGLEYSLNVAIAEINVKQAQIGATIAELDRRSALLKQQQAAREDRVRSFYMQLKQDRVSPMLALLDANDFQAYAKMLGYHQSALDDDRQRILELDQLVDQLNKEKADLEGQIKALEDEKATLQQRAEVIRSQISIARSQQSGLNNQIVSLGRDIEGLTAKQNAIIQQKIAANAQRTTVGGSELVSTPLPNPGFSPAFAFASYGYPHRVGMSQYGAKGRAEAGQNYQTILKTYYAGINVGHYNTPSHITVNGCNEYGQCFNNQTYPFEEYLKHLYEMPASWPMEALKAQAVAARTYALKWLNDHPGQAICPNQSCQVVKHEINASSWQQAVNATAGIVATHGGAPISTWYSSTVGGYTQSSQQVWGGFTPYTHVVRDYAGSWPNGGYDKQSPWYHKAWGSRTGGGYNPWMTKAEVVDLLNAALLYQSAGSSGPDFDIGQPGNDGSSPEQIINALNARGIQPIGDFHHFEFSHSDATGQTTLVRVIGGPRGVTDLSGGSVYAAVNLRSPGTIWLTSTLFDVITQ